jgi:hypothetical protein
MLATRQVFSHKRKLVLKSSQEFSRVLKSSHIRAQYFSRFSGILTQEHNTSQEFSRFVEGSQDSPQYIYIYMCIYVSRVFKCSQELSPTIKNDLKVFQDVPQLSQKCSNVLKRSHPSAQYFSEISGVLQSFQPRTQYSPSALTQELKSDQDFSRALTQKHVSRDLNRSNFLTTDHTTVQDFSGVIASEYERSQEINKSQTRAQYLSKALERP